MSTASPRLTVVLASARSAATVEETLASIERSAVAYPGAVEVMLVRDTEPDNSWRRIRLTGLDLSVIFTGGRQGSAVTRYTGMLAASSDVLLFTDDDTLVGVDWITRMSEAVVREGTCAGSIRSRTDGFWERCDERIDRYRIRARDDAGQLKFISFPVFGVSRALVPQPPFEISSRNKADDTDLACTLRLHGVRLHLEDSIEVEALYPTTYRSFFTRKVRHGIGLGRLRVRLGRDAWTGLGLGSLPGLFIRWLRLSTELSADRSLLRRAQVLAANLAYCIALVAAAAIYRLAPPSRRPTPVSASSRRMVDR